MSLKSRKQITDMISQDLGIIYNSTVRQFSNVEVAWILSPLYKKVLSHLEDELGCQIINKVWAAIKGE